MEEKTLIVELGEFHPRAAKAYNIIVFKLETVNLLIQFDKFMVPLS